MYREVERGAKLNPCPEVTTLLAARHTGPAKVTVAPGLEATHGTTSTTITLVIP
jgi:hypothetical protein